MSIVILATIPLITVPTGELIYRKLPSVLRSYDSIKMLSLIRIIICLFSAIISIEVPGFVTAISLTGCFSVASLSFVYPPLVHLVLQCKSRRYKTHLFFVDIVLLLLGTIATTISTSLIFQSLIASGWEAMSVFIIIPPKWRYYYEEKALLYSRHLMPSTIFVYDCIMIRERERERSRRTI